jgi:hypothetical protein
MTCSAFCGLCGTGHVVETPQKVVRNGTNQNRRLNED